MTSTTLRIVFLTMAVVLCAAGAASASLLFPSPAEDLALTGTGFSQSDLDAGHTGARLVDGERDGNFGNPNTIAHSDAVSVNPYMGVLLSSARSLASIIIFNRTGDPGYGDARIDYAGTIPFTVDIVSGATGPDTGGTVVFTNTYLFTPDIVLGGGVAQGMTISLPPIPTANEIIVTQHVPDGGGFGLYMNLAEIEAYAVPEPASCLLLGAGSLSLLVRGNRIKATK